MLALSISFIGDDCVRSISSRRLEERIDRPGNPDVGCARFGKLSLRGIARDLGVSHAAPLRHFPTKADLLREIAQTDVERLIEASKSADDLKPGLNRLRKMVNSYIQWATENTVYHQILRDPDVMRQASDALKSVLNGLVETQLDDIKTAQFHGWRADVDSSVLYLHLVSLTAGTSIVLSEPMYAAVRGGELRRTSIQQSLVHFPGRRRSTMKMPNETNQDLRSPSGWMFTWCACLGCLGSAAL